MVMTDQLPAAIMQPVKWQLVARQDKHLVGDLPRDIIERFEIKAERIAFRVYRLDADIGGDPGDDLVGGQKHVLRWAVEHELLGRVAIAGEHDKITTADF